MTAGLGIEPGPHGWEASALTTAPSLLPLLMPHLQNNRLPLAFKHHPDPHHLHYPGLIMDSPNRTADGAVNTKEVCFRRKSKFFQVAEDFGENQEAFRKFLGRLEVMFLRV